MDRLKVLPGTILTVLCLLLQLTIPFSQKQAFRRLDAIEEFCSLMLGMNIGFEGFYSLLFSIYSALV